MQENYKEAMQILLDTVIGDVNPDYHLSVDLATDLLEYKLQIVKRSSCYAYVTETMAFDDCVKLGQLETVTIHDLITF